MPGVKRQFVSRLLLGGSVMLCYQRAADAAPPDSTYRLIFADEFNATSVDTSKWNIASPSWTMPNSLSTASSSQVSESGGDGSRCMRRRR